MRCRGQGPTPCEFLLIGEGPGFDEDRVGYPFAPRGKTGQEIRRLFDGYELPAFEDIFRTNIFREYRGKDYRYSESDLEADEPELLQDLYKTRPTIIIAMGRYAARYFLGDIDLDAVQGIPWSAEICYACAGDGRKVLVATEEDRKRLLAVDGGSQQQGLRKAHLLLPKLVSPPTSLVVRLQNEAKGTRPSLLQHKMRQSSTSRSGLNKGKQPTSQGKATGVSMGSFADSQKHLHLPTDACSPVSNMRQSPRKTSLCPACGNRFTKITVFPVVHVAAGFHNPEMSPYVIEGFKSLAQFLDGKLNVRGLYDDPYPKPKYVEITSKDHLRDISRKWDKKWKVSIDTEGWPGNPWSLQFSDNFGVGYLIRRTRPDLLAAFILRVNERQPILVFHSALHDLGMGRALGTNFEGLQFLDTMVMAYLLQIEPQGLKPGCLRHCNMQMDDYTDILGDAGDRIAIEYLTWLWDLLTLEREEQSQAEFDRLVSTPYKDKKGNWKPGRKLKTVKLLPKSKLHAAVERCLNSKRPRGLWNDQIEDIEVAAYNRMGPMPEATLDYVEPERAIAYGCRDADGTLRYEAELSKRIDAKGLRKVYELELSTYPLLDRMARIGVKPDLEHFASLSSKLQNEIDRIQASLVEHTERDDFNANSGDQVADYIFGTLGLEEMKLTRSGRGSTNDKILEALEHEHPEFPVLSAIREYREVYKLKNTFVDRLPDFVHRWPFDGRIHATFRTTRVVTGRLAASDPNLLAQPEHGKFAKDFKRGWICEDGHVIGQWDESQVELRGLAHLSQDPVMLATFRGERRNKDGSLVDLHAALAERIFGVKPKDQDKSKHRLPAKAINFGIPMGMTNKGLSVELRKNGVDADEDTAQRWLDETLGLYTGVQSYMDARIAEARRHGYVRCLSGRIRYIGGIRSRDERVRAEAERFAFSTPIQESATLIMKQAEKIVYEDICVPLWKQGRWVEPILQIHDCLKMECEEGLIKDLHRMMTKAMTQVPISFSVPLVVEGEWGRNMAEMVKFE